MKWRRMLLLLLTLVTLIAVLARLGLQAMLFAHPPRFTNAATPSDFGIVNWEAISFETQDGLTLDGWYIAPTRADGATLLFVHGLAGSRHTFLPELDFLHNDGGYGALLFDLRNHGTSDGTVTTMSNAEILDVQAAFAWLALRPDVQIENIVLYGKSMGGATAIRAMPTLPQARALIVDTAYTSMADVTRDGIRNIGIPPLFFHHIILGMTNVLAGSNLYDARPIDSIAYIVPRPILFIHGTADRTIPVQHIYDLHAAAGNPKELLIVEGADHIASHQTDPAIFEQRMLSFLEDVFSNR